MFSNKPFHFHSGTAQSLVPVSTLCAVSVLLVACASQHDPAETHGGPLNELTRSEQKSQVVAEPLVDPVYVDPVDVEPIDSIEAELDDYAPVLDEVSVSHADATRSVQPQGQSQAKTTAAPQPPVQSFMAMDRRAVKPMMAEASVYPLPAPPHILPSPVRVDDDREQYASMDQSPVHRVSQNPVSTFSIDVDTGSYTNVRRMLNQGYLPQADAVRVEEFINYFDYDYPSSASADQPFSVTTELAEAPWSERDAQGHRKHALLKIGLKAYEPALAERPPANLVFLVDVSGSMSAANKLPLLKQSLEMLTKQLSEKDRVSLVVYAGASGVVLENCAGNDTRTIVNALRNLNAGGSTNGQAGIEQAYHLAQKWQIPGGINRVMLATDGDFNVGVSNVEALKQMIERKREQGVSLSTLGLGSGNYNDHLMEQLADVGNGNYAYIDTLKEAHKVLVQSLSSTIMTVAKDVKIQIEFNPEHVEEYRLVGYENRALKREDFNNDKVDAGEIGAGHTVTAIYELALAGRGAARMDDLRYGPHANSERDHSDVSHTSITLAQEMAFLKVRYKQPSGQQSQLMTFPIAKPQALTSVQGASDDFKFSASVAYFGEVLRGSPYVSSGALGSGKLDSNLIGSRAGMGVNTPVRVYGHETPKLGNGPQDGQKRVDNNAFQTIINLANESKGQDAFGYRSEFVQLVRLAESLSPAS